MKSNVVCPSCKADNCPYNDTCIKCDHPLIGDELRVLDGITTAWNEFVKLPKMHPDETEEFKDCVHRMQGLIASRMASKLTTGIFKVFTERPTAPPPIPKSIINA